MKKSILVFVLLSVLPCYAYAAEPSRAPALPPPGLTERQNADHLFNERDLNKDKGISNYEYVTYVGERFNYIDQDDDGLLTLQECLWAFGEGDLKDAPKDKILSGHLFLKNQDGDGDGKITEYESLQNANRLFKEMDADGDDNVTADEYFASMQKGKVLKKQEEEEE